jgi:hypothetical protein
MPLNQDSGFPADKLAALKAAYAEYTRLKEEFLADIVKATSGKINTLDIPSAIKWLPFVQDNPKLVTNTKYIVADFAFKAKAHPILIEIEAMESAGQGHTKAVHDIVSSDLRYYWTNAEDFYLDIDPTDTVTIEKYKDLPSISPKRKTDAQIESDFKKLEARRNKKNTDNTDTKV